MAMPASIGPRRAASAVRKGTGGPAGLTVMPTGSVTLSDAYDPGERAPTRLGATAELTVPAIRGVQSRSIWGRRRRWSGACFPGRGLTVAGGSSRGPLLLGGRPTRYLPLAAGRDGAGVMLAGVRGTGGPGGSR